MHRHGRTSIVTWHTVVLDTKDFAAAGPTCVKLVQPGEKSRRVCKNSQGSQPLKSELCRQIGELLAENGLLGAHSDGCHHGKAAVVQLLGLHVV